MNEASVAFAKLAGTRKAVQALLESTLTQGRPIGNFSLADVGMYFEGAVKQIEVLRVNMQYLFGDFAQIQVDPSIEMPEGAKEPMRFGRGQLEYLVRSIDQVFEVRANSELAIPEDSKPGAKVFITHGVAGDWREVQNYIERDIGISTLELAQEPNLGRTVLQKLDEESSNCSSAVIVMTGDDLDGEGNPRARENVMHEIGYFQAKYGLSAVCLLHEEGTNIPSNIHGLVYIPFTKGYVQATFGALMRELKAIYKMQ